MSCGNDGADCVGMTWEGAGMTWEGAGMTWEGVGMTWEGAGMVESPNMLRHGRKTCRKSERNRREIFY